MMGRLTLSFKSFANLIYKRQVEKDADTFIIIYGLPRSGKTTLGFDILDPYIKLMREKSKTNKNLWKPERYWSEHFKKYFASDSEDMNKKIKNNPNGSYTFIDEGIDVLSWMEMMSREQKNLVELIQKTGKKHMLTILVTPNMGLLTKSILTRAHYLFIIMDEPTKEGNYAFMLKNYTNPFLAETQPFGLSRMFKDFKKIPNLTENKYRLYKYMRDRSRLVGVKRFHRFNQKIYKLYDKMVKEPSIMRGSKTKRMIPYAKYHKLDYTFKTILYNLYIRDGKSVAQIHRLLTDKFGSNLISKTTIQTYINKISSLEVKPDLSEDRIIEIKEPKKIEANEDVKI